VKVLDLVTQRKTEPSLSLDATLEICDEMMEYLYEGAGEIEPLTLEEQAIRLSVAPKELAALLDGTLSVDELVKTFKPRSSRPVN
jgi:hypothetical protein